MTPSSAGCAQPWLEPDVATLETNSGSSAEDRDGHPERDQEHDDDRALAELDVVLLGLDVGAADEPARADDQGLVQDDQAADERPLGERVPYGRRDRGAPWR